MNDITVLSSARMTSLEISSLTGKRHDNVKRTIETIAEKSVIVLPQSEDVPYVDESGRNRITSAYIFTGEQGKRDSIVVVAQLSPEFTGKLVDRWQALESGEATPAFKAQPKQSKADRLRAREVKEAFNCFFSIAQMCKFDGNMAILSANQATQAFTGINPLQLMGRASLEAEGQDALLIVSEIAGRLGVKTREVNPLLTKSGLQSDYRDTKDRICYELTETGKAFGVYLDTNKKHSDGAPVRQIKWRASVVTFLLEQARIDEDAE